MDNEKLRENLEELNLELLKLSPTAKSAEQARDRLVASISETLDRDDLGGFHLSLKSLKEVIDDSITTFEIEHPKVTELIARIENLFSSIGI